MIAGGDGEVDTRSLRWQLVAVFGAVALLLIPSALSWDGSSHERHALFLVSIPISVVLLARLRRDHRAQPADPPRRGARGGERRGLVAASAAIASCSRVATRRDRARLGGARALARRSSARRSGSNEFFIAVVIVAIVGNAAEHGGAVVIAQRGNTTLATEIAITSSMQVAVFVDARGLPALVDRRPRAAALVPR